MFIGKNTVLYNLAFFFNEKVQINESLGQLTTTLLKIILLLLTVFDKGGSILAVTLWCYQGNL